MPVLDTRYDTSMTGFIDRELSDTYLDTTFESYSDVVTEDYPKDDREKYHPYCWPAETRFKRPPRKLGRPFTLSRPLGPRILKLPLRNRRRFMSRFR